MATRERNDVHPKPVTSKRDIQRIAAAEDDAGVVDQQAMASAASAASNSNDAPKRAPKSPGAVGYELATLWVLMLAMLAWFIPFAISTGAGITAAIVNSSRSARVEGDAGMGGIGFVLIDIVGVVLLGGALAYGLYRYHTRPRELDRVSEAATHEQYDKPTTA